MIWIGMLNRNHGLLAASVVALAALILTSCSQQSETSADDPSPPGADRSATSKKAAPDFTLTDLSGKTVRLSDFKGKVVMLDFWATWCPPCRREIPDLIQLQNQYADKGFTVLGISLDDGGAATVKPFAQSIGMNYPLVIGNSQVTAAYGAIEAIPTTFLIGRDGMILKTYVGAQDKSEFQSDIQSAL
jgi:peroxiredoxin